MRSGCKWLAIILAGVPLRAAAPPETEAAFARYVSAAEKAMAGAGNFEWTAGQPKLRDQVRRGKTVVRQTPQSTDVDIPGGTLQDWSGAIFLPGVTLARVRGVLEDYADYKEFYKPEVMASRVISHHGGDFDIYLRLARKQILLVVLDAEYHVYYQPAGPHRLRVISRSTRIREVANPGSASEHPVKPEDEFGFLWNLNSYWSLEETPEGVWAECRAISLSRDVPLGLGWFLGSFIKQFPRQSMQRTLEGTRKAALRAAPAGGT